eukprot:m.160620 g.160620  ORF g.160620 m.160620 type:complete len:202 (+) comp9851_c0_seq3:2348-2953(+)
MEATFDTRMEGFRRGLQEALEAGQQARKTRLQAMETRLQAVKTELQTKNRELARRLDAIEVPLLLRDLVSEMDRELLTALKSQLGAQLPRVSSLGNLLTALCDKPCDPVLLQKVRNFLSTRMSMTIEDLRRARRTVQKLGRGNLITHVDPLDRLRVLATSPERLPALIANVSTDPELLRASTCILDIYVRLLRGASAAGAP